MPFPSGWVAHPGDQFAYALDFAADLAHLLPPLLLAITDVLDRSLNFLDDKVDTFPVGIEALL